jgi:hypothetical protein
MSTYWQQKLSVAPGSEPETCRRLIDLLTPYIYGKYDSTIAIILDLFMF